MGFPWFSRSIAIKLGRLDSNGNGRGTQGVVEHRQQSRGAVAVFGAAGVQMRPRLRPKGWRINFHNPCYTLYHIYHIIYIYISYISHIHIYIIHIIYIYIHMYHIYIYMYVYHMLIFDILYTLYYIYIISYTLLYVYNNVYIMCYVYTMCILFRWFVFIFLMMYRLSCIDMYCAYIIYILFYRLSDFMYVLCTYPVYIIYIYIYIYIYI